MKASYHFFEFQKSRLGYMKAGNGPGSLLIFHGFGQDHTIFNQLAEELKDQFTLYAFDLFFHGQSEWQYGEKPLSKPFWSNLLESFLQEAKIEKFSLIGYSLGGKFALASMECLPSRVNGIYLIAPDGIKTNTWYSLATYPLVLRSLFKSLISKPERFHSIIKLAHSLRLADPKVIRFAESQMDTEEKRKRVYYSWVVFRRLKFNINKLAGLVNTHDIILWVIVGKHDRVITPENMQDLLSQVPQHTLKVLDSGHSTLIHESVKELRNIRP